MLLSTKPGSALATTWKALSLASRTGIQRALGQSRLLDLPRKQTRSAGIDVAPAEAAFEGEERPAESEASRAWHHRLLELLPWLLPDCTAEAAPSTLPFIREPSTPRRPQQVSALSVRCFGCFG